MTREWWQDGSDAINEGAEVGIRSIRFVKGMGTREETALVGRLRIQMRPSQSERGILAWKPGRYLLKCHWQMPRYVLFSFPKCFCEFLIDSNYRYLNVRILLFQSESIKAFEAFYQWTCVQLNTQICVQLSQFPQFLQGQQHQIKQQHCQPLSSQSAPFQSLHPPSKRNSIDELCLFRSNKTIF